ncbi:MAG: HlyD family secretion protein [Burkholderiales bacterium]|nr:HlyD family secretion protein [Burkholderiales bacterium]
MKITAPGTRLLAASRRMLRFAALVGVPLVVVVVGLYFYARGGRVQETENAYVKANIVAISAAITGRVIEVHVADNEAVKAGTVLFRLDPEPFQIAAAGARAQMEVVRTDVDSLRAQYRATLLERAEVEEQIAFLTRQLERQEMLKARGMARADVYDEAKHNLTMAQRRLQSLQEQTNRVVASLGGDPQLTPERHPRHVEARALYDAAMLDVSRTQIKAPVDGVVSNMKLQIGEYVDRGKAVFSLIESGPLWVEANFKETQLTHMREGQRAVVVADAYPDVKWPALVETIAPATGAEFAVLPPQNATGNWVKVVQRIPVRIQVQQPPGQPPLRAGMTVTVSVDTGRQRGLPRMVRRLIDSGLLPQALMPSEAVAGR